MDLLQNYADQNDDRSVESDNHGQQNPNSSPDSSPPHLLPAKSAAPQVNDTMLALTIGQANRTLSKPIDPTQHVIPFNPTYDQLWAPLHGPAHSYAKDGIAQGMRNHKLGFVEDASIEPFVFDEQYNAFYKFGYAADPSALLDIIMLGTWSHCRRMMGFQFTTYHSMNRRGGSLKRKKNQRTMRMQREMMLT